MSRKHDVSPEAFRLPPRPSRGVSHIGDLDLAVGVSLNGAPARRAAGDHRVHLIQVKCSCGQLIGALFEHDARPRRQERFYFVETLVVVDPDARPVATTKATFEVRPARRITADCPAHGPQNLDSDALIRRARKIAARAAAGNLKIGRYIAEGHAAP